MDKKALLAIILSFFVLYTYQSYFIPPPAQMAEIAATSEEGVITPEKVKEVASPVITEDKKAVSIEKKATPPVQEKAKDFLFEGDKFAALFSSRGGGGLKSLRLKEYRENIEDSASTVERINIDKNGPLPLSISFKSADISLSPDIIFEEAKRGENELLYSWESEKGVRLEKKYILRPDDYKIHIEVSILNRSDKPVSGSLAINLFEKDAEKGDMYTFIGQAVKLNDDIDTKSFEDVEKTPHTLDGDIRWLATENKYFITALLPKSEGEKRVSAR